MAKKQTSTKKPVAKKATTKKATAKKPTAKAKPKTATKKPAAKKPTTRAIAKPAIRRPDPNYGRSNNHPIYCVNWYEAVEFCNKLSEMEGLTPYYTINKAVGSDPNNTDEYDQYRWLVTPNTSANGYRLPTEAQWEYAAKGGNGSPGNYTYAGSNNVDDVAWYQGNRGGEGNTYTTKVVGTKAANGLGIYDMSGNVREWCWDWSGDYTSGAQTDPMGASSGPGRVRRGGDILLPASMVRSAYRGYDKPRSRDNDMGFRVVRSL